jgi:tetratricopeptide (TPR) repeat protein
MNIQTIKTQFWPIVLLVLVGGIIYANTLNVPFHFDDKSNIYNPALKIETLSGEQFRKTLSGSTLKARPVSNLSFALNYFVGRYHVQGYHLVNTGIHICAGIFLYLLLQITLNLTVNKQNFTKGSAIALMTALLWIAHPVATQSVTYVVQRMNSMAAMFFILAMLLYATGRIRQIGMKIKKSSFPIWGWFVASGLSSFFAIGSKEIAVTIPVFIFLYEWYFFQDLRWEWLKNKLYWLVGIFFGMGCIAYAYTNGQIINSIFNNCSGRDFSTMERVFTQFRVIIHYITLLFYPNPNRLALDYDFPISTSLLSPLSTLYSLFAIVSLLILSILLARRERLVSFCILWFFGNLIIESSVICLEMVFEHRTYLPSMFLILLFVAMLYRVGKRNTAFISLLLVLASILLGYWTFERNKVWQTSLSLWSDSASKYPNKARPHGNLAVAFTEMGELDLAEEEYQKALTLYKQADTLDPSLAIAHNNLASILLQQGRKEEAALHLQEAIRIKPDYVFALVNFGELLREQGLYEKAINEFIKALRIVPENGTVNKNLGNALLRIGRFDDALPYLQKAISNSSHDPEILLDLGECLVGLGHIEDAINAYRDILKKNRNHASAHYHLALLLKQNDSGQEAIFHYRNADRLLRYPFDLKYDFGNHLFRLGELQEAEKLYREFIGISPSLVKAHNNLGLVLVNQGRYKEAVQQFQKASNMDPSFQLAADNLRLAMEQLMSMELEKEEGR